MLILCAVPCQSEQSPQAGDWLRFAQSRVSVRLCLCGLALIVESPLIDSSLPSLRMLTANRSLVRRGLRTSPFAQ